MKTLCFFINTPGQVYTWRFLIQDLMKTGHRVTILARQYRETIALLDRYGVDHTQYMSTPGSGYLKPISMFAHLPKACNICRKAGADVILGFGIDAALAGWLMRKPSILFTDYEGVPLQHFVARHFASVILTPACFGRDLGRKHLRVEAYKELAYLHPNRFHPDPSVRRELGIDDDEKYVVLRFNAPDAVHDLSFTGFSDDDRYRLVERLGKYTRVFISTAGDLPADLEAFRLPTHPSRIHDVLSYAQLLVCDTRTMAWEAAILGTPAVTCGSFAGHLGNLTELEERYGLLYTFSDIDRALAKALALVQDDRVKVEWAEKRDRLLQDKVDLTDFMIWFIDNYPESLGECRRNRESTLICKELPDKAVSRQSRP